MRVYVAHPFAGDVASNVAKVRAICLDIVREGHTPVAPHLYLPAFVDEATERELALRLCTELVAGCDAVRLYGPQVTAGMAREIAAAEERGIPVVNRLRPFTARRRELSFLALRQVTDQAGATAALEVALLRVDAESLAVLYRYNAAAGEVVPAREALAKLALGLRESTIAGHEVDALWSSAGRAFRAQGVPPPAIERPLLDTASLAWPLLRAGRIPSVSLADLCAHLGLPAETPPSAAAQVERDFTVFRRLVQGAC